jgi:hypothetical protein
MIQSKKDFIQEKYKNFMNVLINKSCMSLEELENEPDIKSFKDMTPEDILKFGLSTLQPYKNNLDFPAERVMQTFKIDPLDKSTKMIIINYLEMILSIST